MVSMTQTYREMLEGIDVVRKFVPAAMDQMAAAVAERGKVHIVAQGSSLLLPGQNFLDQGKRKGSLSAQWDLQAMDGTTAQDWGHEGRIVIFMSNSGNTHEVITAARHLQQEGHPALFGMTTNPDSMLAGLFDRGHTHILNCGKEDATAATKSVLEQTLCLQALLPGQIAALTPEKLNTAADAMGYMLTREKPDENIIDRLAQAPALHMAGPSNGVVRELSLKFSEACRPAPAHENTTLIHGFHAKLPDKSAILLFEPKEEDEAKFRAALLENPKRPDAGFAVFAVSHRETSFPTIKILRIAGLNALVQLAAGWRILAGIADRKGVNLDDTSADKIGYEAVARPG